MTRILTVLAAVGVAQVAFPAVSSADIYRYVDADGVVHYTNIKPRGKQAHKWRRVMKASPKKGKPAARRGTCERCDVVPARDRSPDRYHRYDEFIREASALYHIPPALIRAVIKQESDYDPRVVSSMGARGLMQLMPEVVKDMGVRNVHDPRENILGGTRLLRVLANHYNGDLVLTIAGYHAGIGALARFGNTVPPFPYTRDYVRKVLRHYYKFKALEARTAKR